MPKEKNIEQVREIRADLESSKALLITDYRGLTVSQITTLRRKLRETGAEYKVVKNTLFHLAAEGLISNEIDEMLAGPTAIAFVSDDPIAPAKILSDFVKESKILSLKGGYFEGMVYSAEQVQALAKIPPKDVLIAQVVGGIAAPLSGLVGTLNGVISNFVYTLQAVADQKAA